MGGMASGFEASASSPADIFNISPPRRVTVSHQQQLAAPSHPAPPADDLDIFASPAAPRPSQAANPEDIFNSVPAPARPPPQTQTQSQPQATPQASQTQFRRPAAAAGAAMMDFGEEASSAAVAAVMAAAGDVAVEGEPELRKVSRGAS